jgi:hypothetical protein
MTENNLHNLMTQMTQEQKSLWRIENNYINEASSDEEKTFWQNMKADKEKHIEDLKDLIKKAL